MRLACISDLDLLIGESIEAEQLLMVDSARSTGSTEAWQSRIEIVRKVQW